MMIEKCMLFTLGDGNGSVTEQMVSCGVGIFTSSVIGLQ